MFSLRLRYLNIIRYDTYHTLGKVRMTRHDSYEITNGVICVTKEKATGGWKGKGKKIGR